MLPKLEIKPGCEIITVTLNPVVDKTFWIKDFRPGGTFVAEKSVSLAAGKGVNVSRAISNFGGVSTATGILSKKGSGAYLYLLANEKIHHDFLLTEGLLRANTTVISIQKGNSTETHLREKGPTIERQVLEEFSRKLSFLLSQGSVVVFSGSIPGGLGAGTYFELIKNANECGSKVFFDGSGKLLAEGLKAKPFFIKPNIFEVNDALGLVPRSDGELKKAVRTFHHMGIEYVMITGGSEGLVLGYQGQVVRAKVKLKHPVNSVGSGDSCVAAAVLGVESRLSAQDTARLAAAAGAANTLVSGAGVFSISDVEQLYQRTETKLL
ncbi:MAG: 1-phosphofructokinase family hexose kinase [Spirochaetota bacterium]